MLRPEGPKVGSLGPVGGAFTAGLQGHRHSLKTQPRVPQICSGYPPWRGFGEI